MKATYDEALAHVFYHEGGYTNDAADPGGPTNWGITIYDARMYWKPNATAEDVRRMPIAVAKDIYRKHYADVIRYDDLPPGVDYAVLDYGINSGVRRAAQVLQRLVGVPADGRIGLVTLGATGRYPNKLALIDKIQDERLAFLQGLRTWPTFGRGWTRRVSEVRRWAKQLASKYPWTPPAQTVSVPSVPGPKATADQVESGAKGYAPEPKVNPPTKSRTVWGGVLQALSGVGVAMAGAFQWISTPLGFAAFCILLVLLGVGLWMVLSGRLKVGEQVKKLQELIGAESTPPSESAS